MVRKKQHIRVSPSLQAAIEEIHFEGDRKASTIRRLLQTLDEFPEEWPACKMPTDPLQGGYTYRPVLDEGLKTRLLAAARDRLPNSSLNSRWAFLLATATQLPLPTPWQQKHECLEWLQQFGFQPVALAEIEEKSQNYASHVMLHAWLKDLAHEQQIILWRKQLQVLPFPRTIQLQQARHLLYRKASLPYLDDLLEKGVCLTLARQAIATLQYAEAPPGVTPLDTSSMTQAEFHQALRGVLVSMGAPETRSDSPYESIKPELSEKWIRSRANGKLIKMERIQ